MLQAKDWSERRFFFAAKGVGHDDVSAHFPLPPPHPTLLTLTHLSQPQNLLRVFRREEDTLSEDERLDYYMRERDRVGATVLHVAILCESWDVAKVRLCRACAPEMDTPAYPY